MTWGKDDPVFGRGRGQFNINGERLDKIDWNGTEIVPVRKDFVIQHPSVESRGREECDRIRLKNGIIVETGEHEDVPKPFESLEECSFPEWAAEGLRERGWKFPSPIQIQAWPAALTGHDVVGIASTGSGKTMAYVLPMLVHIIAQPELKAGEGPVGLVLLPHRELCNQVANVLMECAGKTGLQCQSIFGGEDRERQQAGLLERVDVLVATPGRLTEFLYRKTTNLKRATYVVLDEADDLLGQGFEEQISAIMSQIRPDRQVLLFSATWPEEVETFARGICHERPIHINVGGIKLAACKDVDQKFWAPGRGHCPWRIGDQKIEVLKKAVQVIGKLPKEYMEKALIFCNHISDVLPVVEALKEAEVCCEGFTSECTQAVRSELLRRFQEEDDLPILVCTQVLGRGHDFQNVKYVINYDMPHRLVDYVHRVGRTGRAGESGFSLTLLDEPDLRFAKQLVEMLKETGQQPQEWLVQESSRKKQRKYEQIYRDGRYGRLGSALPALTDKPDEPHDVGWEGRGAGRRHTFLELCKGRGVSRRPGQDVSRGHAEPVAASPSAAAPAPVAVAWPTARGLMAR